MKVDREEKVRLMNHANDDSSSGSTLRFIQTA